MWSGLSHGLQLGIGRADRYAGLVQEDGAQLSEPGEYERRRRADARGRHRALPYLRQLVLHAAHSSGLTVHDFELGQLHFIECVVCLEHDESLSMWRLGSESQPLRPRLN